MRTPSKTAEQRAHTLAALNNAAQTLEAAKRTRDRYIVDCADYGASLRSIAQAAGLSHQRVAQIIESARA